jgi:hypothetical protein
MIEINRKKIIFSAVLFLAQIATPRRQAQPPWAHSDRLLQTSCATAVRPLTSFSKRPKPENCAKMIEINRKKIILSVALFFAQNHDATRFVGLEPTTSGLA